MSAKCNEFFHSLFITVATLPIATLSIVASASTTVMVRGEIDYPTCKTVLIDEDNANEAADISTLSKSNLNNKKLAKVAGMAVFTLEASGCGNIAQSISIKLQRNRVKAIATESGYNIQLTKIDRRLADTTVQSDEHFPVKFTEVANSDRYTHVFTTQYTMDRDPPTATLGSTTQVFEYVLSYF